MISGIAEGALEMAAAAGLGWAVMLHWSDFFLPDDIRTRVLVWRLMAALPVFGLCYVAVMVGIESLDGVAGVERNWLFWLLAGGVFAVGMVLPVVVTLKASEERLHRPLREAWTEDGDKSWWTRVSRPRWGDPTWVGLLGGVVGLVLGIEVVSASPGLLARNAPATAMRLHDWSEMDAATFGAVSGGPPMMLGMLIGAAAWLWRHHHLSRERVKNLRSG